MTFVYNEAKRAFAAAEIDTDAPDDFRIVLVMSNTTADTEDDTNLMNGFTTLDEFDGATYTRQELAGDALNEDSANNRAEYDANDTSFTTVGAGTRQVVGALLIKHITDDTDSVPLAYYNGTGFPFSANGSTVTLVWDLQGILQFS